MRFKQLVMQHVFWRGLYFLSVFILNILISRHFKAEGSGWIFYTINNLSLLLLIAGLSLESGAVYYSSTGEIASQKIAVFCLFWSLAGTFFCLFIIKWLGPVYYPNLIVKPEFIPGSIGYIAGILMTNYFSGLFFAKQDFFLPNLIILLVNLLLIFLLIAYGMHPFVQDHFAVIYLSSFFLQGLVLIIAYFNKTFNWGSSFLLSATDLKKLIGYSSLALLANIVFFLVYRVDYWFVKKFCTAHDLGNYIQVSKLAQLFLILPNMLASIIFPKMAFEKETHAGLSVKILARNLFVLTLLLLAFLVLSGKWLFPFVFGNTFNSMYYPFVFLIPGILSLVMVFLFSAYFAGKNKVKVNVLGSCIALPLILALDAVFIPRYGIYAAAMISSIGYFAVFVFSVSQYKKTAQNDDKITDFFLPQRSDYILIREFWRERYRKSR